MSLSSARTVQVAIVDDHSIVRQGVKSVLDLHPDIDVVAEGECGADAVRVARDHHLDVILLDIQMPGQSATQTLAEIRQVAPRTRVIVFTGHEEAEVAAQVIDAGAMAFITKVTGHEELARVIRSVAARPMGEVSITGVRRGNWTPRSDTTGSALSEPGAQSTDRRDKAPGSIALTVREVEVLRYVGLAWTNARIARHLGVSEGTVKRHLSNINRKLGASSRWDALRRGAERGIEVGMDVEHPSDC